MQKASPLEFLDLVEDPVTPTHLTADVKPHVISPSLSITHFLFQAASFNSTKPLKRNLPFV